MKQTSSTTAANSDIFSLPASEISKLYSGTVDELRQCAAHVPEISSDSSSLDAREAVLLGFQDMLLELAAKVPLNAAEDVQALIDIWEQESGVTDPEQARPSDQLILNIFRNLYSEPALKTVLLTG